MSSLRRSLGSSSLKRSMEKASSSGTNASSVDPGMARACDEFGDFILDVAYLIPRSAPAKVVYSPFIYIY